MISLHTTRRDWLMVRCYLMVKMHRYYNCRWFSDPGFLCFWSGLPSAAQLMLVLLPLQFPLGTFPQNEFMPGNAQVFLQTWWLIEFSLLFPHRHWHPKHFSKLSWESQPLMIKTHFTPGMVKRYWTISTNDLIESKRY